MSDDKTMKLKMQDKKIVLHPLSLWMCYNMVTIFYGTIQRRE